MRVKVLGFFLISLSRVMCICERMAAVLTIITHVLLMLLKAQKTLSPCLTMVMREQYTVRDSASMWEQYVTLFLRSPIL